MPTQIESGKVRFMVTESQHETIVEQEIYPFSWLEMHRAFEWPEKVFGGCYAVDQDGVYKFDFWWIPSVPKSWEKIYK